MFTRGIGQIPAQIREMEHDFMGYGRSSKTSSNHLRQSQRRVWWTMVDTKVERYSPITRVFHYVSLVPELI